LSISAGTARAIDWAWGWGGWGNWASTPEGDIGQGLGYYYTGAGIYNEKTAIADSINADTMMRWNQYLHEATMEATRRYVARRQGNSDRINTARAQILKNLQENPTARDIETGDALNVAVAQLSDPRISSSALKLAKAPVEASVIREIPFRNASEAVTIVLSHVKTGTKWPRALEGERFAEEKKAFEEIVDRAVKEDEEGDISADTLKQAHELISHLRSKLAAQPLEPGAATQEALKFFKTVAGLIRMLERPDTSEAFNQLRSITSTSLGNLLAFMEVYNLRFGAATTPAQRSTYRRLFPLLDNVRNRIVQEAKLTDHAEVLDNPACVGEFFSKFDAKQAEVRAKQAETRAKQ
jgi:hypothetical protein